MSFENEYDEDAENLRKLFESNNIVSFKIKEVQCTAGSSSGDNYMSVVKRVKISATATENSNTENENNLNKQAKNENPLSHTKEQQQLLTVIIKRQIPSLSRRQLYRCDEAFNNEINAYQHMVPLLQQYTNMAQPEHQIFPKCYFAGKDDLGEIIVLEDLKEVGFRMQNRLTGLNFNYCELVMKQLARFHAASIAAKQLDTEVFYEKCSHLKEIIYCKEAEEFYKNILEVSIEESLNSLRASNVDDCLTEPIRQIERLQTKLFHQLQDCIINSKESMSVICHGDLWVNNIMFGNAQAMHQSIMNYFAKIPNGENVATAPVSAKFLDLQAMRYTSPVFDLLHFFYTSTKRDLRDGHTKRLLEIYCLALSANLEDLFSHAQQQLRVLQDIFSLSNIIQEYYKHVLYGLAISMWILPAVTFDPNNIPNLDAISEMNAGMSAKEIKCTQKLTPEYHSRLKDLALEFHHNGYFNNYLSDDD